MSPSRYPYDDPILPKLCLGPGDSFCADYEDPRRLLGSNLPIGLKKIIADRLADKTDSDWESELDVSDENGSGSDTDSYAGARRGPREPRRSRSRDSAGEAIIIRRDPREDDYYGVDRRRRVKEPFRIATLAFGSRYGDFAMISSENGEYFLDGNVFERLDTLRRWLIPGVAMHEPVDRAPIKKRNGADIRLFLGAESTYFAVDTTTREYVTNIDSATFRDWIWECIDPFDPRSTKTPILRKDYVPHSLVLGPDDMFCWISPKAFKVNNVFRSAFPSIERFLTYSKAKKILGKVTFIANTDTQPGSKLPYYVLSTADGVCVSAVPASASDIISKYSTRWGALRCAKQAREIKSAKSSAAAADIAYDTLKSPVAQSWELLQGGDESRSEPNMASKALSVLTDLKRIHDDCYDHALDSQTWVHASLADRIHMLLTAGTRDGDLPPKWEDLVTKSLLRDIRVAGKTVAGGKYVKEDSKEPPEVTTMYITHQVEKINHVCESNKITGTCDDWETLDLSERVAAIAVNQQTPELRNKINSGIWALNSHTGIPKELTSSQQMDIILEGLETINGYLNNVPFANDEWRARPLADKVHTIVAQRQVLDQESDKPPRELLSELMGAIFDLIPAEGIRSDPTGLEYVATIRKELRSIHDAVYDNFNPKIPDPATFLNWRNQTLAQRLNADFALFTQMRDEWIEAAGRLETEFEKIPPGESRDRAFEIIRKVFPDADIVDNKKEEKKPVSPADEENGEPKKEEKKTEYPIYDPDA